MKGHRLSSEGGISVTFIALGGNILGLEAPDRTGRRANVVLGLPQPEDYAANRAYLGCVVGRYANRIASARFVLDGVTYQLDPTDGASSVHGGRDGFHLRSWAVTQASDTAATLALTSPDGDQGYPGTLKVTMRYSLPEPMTFRIDYEAETDRPTIVNLTNHSYFNLAGEGTGSALDHELTVHAGHYTPSDAVLLPTGAIAAVEGTPFDFRHPTRIGARIRDPHPQMIAGYGYDVNYVVGDGRARDPSLPLLEVARLRDPASGRSMAVATSEPGLQFYSGNLLDGTLVGTSGTLYRQSDGLCLETHHFPDSPNRPEFPSVVLRPGERYRSATEYRFSAG